MSFALPSSPASNPEVVKMPVPIILEITSAVALKKPIWRNSPGDLETACSCGLGIRGLLPILCQRPSQPKLPTAVSRN